MRTRSTILGGLAAVIVGQFAVSGCGKEAVSPGVMLAFSSDMSVPKDITAVGLYIRTATGKVIYNNVVQAETDGAGNRSVRLPATFAVLSNGTPATVRVQLIAYGTTKKPFVIRQSTAGVPTDRLSVLRMPLLWINQGSVQGSVVAPASSEPADGLRPRSQGVAPLAEAPFTIPDNGYETPCKGENDSYIGGKCVALDPEAPLPNYVAADAPDSPDAQCFSVEKCFAKPQSLVTRIKDDGSLDLGGTRASIVNLALVTKDNIGIKLPDGRFAVSLDTDSPLEGFTVKDNVITISEAVRDALKTGRATDLIATTECAEKTPAVHICGPWNPVANQMPTGVHGDTPVVADAGPVLSDASTDAPPDGGPDVPILPDPRGIVTSPAERRLGGLALAGSDVYYLRDGTFGPDAPVLFKAPKIPQGNPMGTSVAPIADALGYRMASISFPAGAPASWANKTFIAAFVANPSLEATPKAYLGEAGGIGAPPLNFPGAFTPKGVYATAMGPVFIGSSAGAAGGYRFADPVTAGISITFVPGLPGGELPLVVTTSHAGGSFVLGTNQGRVMRCTVPGGASIQCDFANAKMLPGYPIALAEDANGLVVLAVRPDGTAMEQNYEGVYGVDLTAGTVTTFARHQEYPNDLHFEQAWDVGRNALALAGTSAYVTTAPAQGQASRVYRVERAQNAKPVIFADGLVRAQDIVSDGARLFYVDRGQDSGNPPGFVLQKPLP